MMNTLRVRRMFFKYFLWAALLLIPVYAINNISPHSEAAAKKIRVGYFLFPGFNDRDAKGNLDGYAYEYLREIAKYTGWQYEFVTEMPERSAQGQSTEKMVPLSYDDALYWLEKGKLDIIGSVHKTPWRTEHFAFPDFNSGSNAAVLTVRQDDDRLGYNELKHLDTMRIGIITGSSRNEEFRTYCRQRGIDNLTLVQFDTLEQLMTAFHETKTVDAALTSSLRKIGSERVIASISPSPYYFITNKNSPDILAGLNSAQKEIKINAPYYERELYEKYYGDSGVRSLTLTQEEEDYIRAHPVVHVAMISDYPPLEYFENERYAGVIAAIYHLLEKRTGLQFQFKMAASFPALTEQLQNKEVEVISAIVNDYKWADGYDVTPTKPFMRVGLSIISKNSMPDFLNPTLTWARVRGRTVNLEIPHDKVIYFDTLEECVDAVKNGNADLMLTTTYSSERIAKNPEYSMLNYSSLPKYSCELSVGVANTADPMLLRILNKAVYSLSASEISQCINENTLYYKEPTTWKTFLYQYPLQTAAALLLLMIFIGIIFYYLGRVRQNKKRGDALAQKNVALEQAIRATEEANKAKSSFLSKMSHEIRTPLNAVTGLTTLAAYHARHDPQMQDFLRKIKISTTHLLALVNDILDISKIENKRMSLNNTPFQLSELVHALAAVYESQATAKNIRFEVETKNIEEDWLIGDAMRLNQVLINFLSNALKFTSEAGRITLCIEQQINDKQNVWMKFTVVDTGIGIAEDKIEKIFESFEQENADTTQKYGGTGLGLSIAKALTELMGGKIYLESDKNLGSTFSVELMFAIAKEPPVESPASAPADPYNINLTGRRILLVEDNDLNIEIATELLTMTGATVETALNGQEAVARFSASPARYYDLILMDIQMPILNGYEATRRIRALDHPDAAEIPIYAMTANAFAEDIKAANEAGMNGHIAKPIDVQTLYTTIQSALQSNR